MKVRKPLNKSHLIGQIWEVFNHIPRPCGNSPFTVTDYLMTALAVFVLKFSSLWSFDNATRGGSDGETVDHRRVRRNLKKMLRINRVPSDSGLRRFLDLIDPERLRPAFTKLFAIRQRTNVLRERFVWEKGFYLLSIDGTGVHSSHNLQCPHCGTKEPSNGTTTYYHQTMGAALVHPDQSEVIPLAPEPILKEDGQEKNDGECTALQRMIHRYRQEHPYLKTVVLADSLHSNATIIKLVTSKNMSFILVAKAGNHAYLFDRFYALDETNQTERLEYQDAKGVTHSYLWMNDQSLNQSNADIKVNFLSYQTIDSKGTVMTYSWVTDWQIDAETAPEIARAGRSRWKIENTFNSLKNRGYHLEHNFGHGEQHLATVFLFLTMLCLLVDQIEQLACRLYQKAWQRKKSLKDLWEDIRSNFLKFRLRSWHHLYELIYYGTRDVEPVPDKPD